MKKILFLIHDLGHGGAEKVLVNLVNNMDPSQFDITVMALFGGGVNEQFLSKNIRLIRCHKRLFPGNSYLMKLFTPRQLYRHYIKDHYDIIVSYLEGPSARIVSGCDDPDTKLVSWIHCELKTKEQVSASFRSYAETLACYQRFDRTVCVSDGVRQHCLHVLPLESPSVVLYNTNESTQIMNSSLETVPAGTFSHSDFNIIGVGKLVRNKGFHRLIPIVKKLREDGYPVRLYILGTGPMKAELEEQALRLGISDSVTFLGYQTNPYKYVAKCDLFVCASFAEGFSTAATEALIVGTPVCTVEVSGTKEMLGDHNEYGIVTENDEASLYQGIHSLLENPALLAHYREKALERGKMFHTAQTVRAVEQMLASL